MNIIGIMGDTPSSRRIRGDLQRLLRDYPQYTLLIKLYWIKLKKVLQEEERSLRFSKSLQKMFDEQEREEEAYIDEQRRRELEVEMQKHLELLIEKEQKDLAEMISGLELLMESINSELKNLPQNSDQGVPTIDLTMNPTEFKSRLGSVDPEKVYTLEELKPFQDFLKLVNDFKDQSAELIQRADFAAKEMLANIDENVQELGNFVNEQLKKISINQLDLNAASPTVATVTPLSNDSTPTTDRLIPDPVAVVENENNAIQNRLVQNAQANISHTHDAISPVPTQEGTTMPNASQTATPIAAPPTPNQTTTATEPRTTFPPKPKPTPAQDASIYRMAHILKSLESDYLAKQKQGETSERMTEQELMERMRNAPATLVGPYMRGHYTKEKLSEIEKNLQRQRDDVQASSALTPEQAVEKKKTVRPLPKGYDIGQT